MTEQNSTEDLLKRKFEPFSDWRPASSGRRSVASIVDAVSEAFEPYTKDLQVKVKDLATSLEDVASKSSTDARGYLADAFESLAKKLRP